VTIEENLFNWIGLIKKSQDVARPSQQTTSHRVLGTLPGTNSKLQYSPPNNNLKRNIKTLAKKTVEEKKHVTSLVFEQP
jgi:hypothetical protein